MSNTDQAIKLIQLQNCLENTHELIQLWNCLNNAQREGYLRLLRTIVEEMKHDDKAAIQNVRNGD